MGHMLLQAMANGSEIASWVYRRAPYLTELVEGDLCAVAKAINALEADQYDLHAFFYGLQAISRLEGIAHVAGLENTIHSLWNMALQLQGVMSPFLASASSVVSDETVESEVY
ncbi:hypothetical protein KSC_086710 [Ktedonobacter sp. SOSP1-52]|uniref:hypothetical protein n=1 Tax=Ktedonobacter sp. SOSP1-52 TaxID=2778366 RepID=UPI0019163D9D|nr:hypothetical protein [Ktedonobacter sp. SOSP1-52]GHO69779.1 hypothetical protein KSC_086710 [Ktedonobacter sp. SOSP1-52]